MKDEEDRRLRRALMDLDFTREQYDYLLFLKKKGPTADVESALSASTYMDDVIRPMNKRKYVTFDKTVPGFLLTRHGLDITAEIEDRVYVSESDKTGDDPNKRICITRGRTTDMIKLFYMMCDTGFFVKADGNKAAMKDVMDAFGKFLDANQFFNYSQYMTNAYKTIKENTFLAPFDELYENAREHFKKKKKEEMNS